MVFRSLWILPSKPQIAIFEETLYFLITSYGQCGILFRRNKLISIGNTGNIIQTVSMKTIQLMFYVTKKVELYHLASHVVEKETFIAFESISPYRSVVRVKSVINFSETWSN